MSEYVTEREFNEMMFTHEDYNALKSDIAELEARVEPLQPFKERIIELEEKMRLMRNKVQNEQRLMNVGEVHDSWNASDDFKKGWAACREQFRALLGKENGDE